MGMLLHRKKQHVDMSETINTEVNGVAIDEVVNAEVNAETDKIVDEKGNNNE